MSYRFILLFLIIGLSPVLTPAQPEAGISNIHGRINGMEKAELLVIDAANDSVIHKVTIVGGTFEMKISVSHAGIFIFRIMPVNIGFRAIVEPGEVNISVDTSKTQWYGDRNTPNNSHGLIWQIDQWGTPVAEDWYRMYNETEIDLYRRVSQELYKHLEKYKDTEDSASKIKNSIEELNAAHFARTKDWVAKFIKSAPESASGPFILFDLFSVDSYPDLSYYSDIISIIKGNAMQTPQYANLLEDIGRLGNSLAGKPLPSFVLDQDNGEPFSIERYRGNYVIIDFWASWCAPCRAAIPKLKAAYEEFAGKGLKIVAISTDKDLVAWRRALEHEKMPWVQLIDAPVSSLNDEKLAEYFHIQAIPFYLFIAPNGKIIESGSSADDIIKMLDDIFSKN